MKLVILGSGIAAAMAVGATKALSPEVYSASSPSSVLGGHKAIMRIRNPEVGVLLGCFLERIKVQKMMYWDGTLHHHPNITASNLYSQKAYGEIGYRSIDNLGQEERYLLSGDISIQHCNYEHQVRRIAGKRIYFKGKKNPVRYDYCISTMPLPALVEVCGAKTELKLRGEPITIFRGDLRAVPSCVHQTIYFPQREFRAYRATLQGQVLIIEGVGEVLESELSSIIKLFGLGLSDFLKFSRSTHPRGKLCRVDEKKRQALLLRLTSEHGIFSFGRYAIWKPIRTDHLVKDIGQIKKMLSSYSEYNLKKGNLQ